MNILGISGSLRADSHNTRLLREAARLLPGGTELTLLDPEILRAIPPYDEDARSASPDPFAVAALRQAISRADGVLVATPEYNSSIPGVLKNALDWASRPLGESPLRGKDAAVIGASTGMFGAVWAQAETRKVLSAVGARVVDLELPVGSADDAWEDDGTLRDSELRKQLAAHLTALIEAADVSRAATLARAA